MAARTVPVTTILFQNMEAALPSNAYVTPSQYYTTEMLMTYFTQVANVAIQIWLLNSRAVHYMYPNIFVTYYS